MVFTGTSAQVETADKTLMHDTEPVQTIILFNQTTEELISFNFTLDDVFQRDRWDEVVINREPILQKKRA